MKELTFDEQRIVQLDILKEVDRFCKNNNIRYSLAFGTLLGAVRHKGYIPWDDDLDIMMPIDDMIKLIEVFDSKSCFFHDVTTDPAYGNPFGNICSNNTYRLFGKLKTRGLGIDVYPIVKIPSERAMEDCYFKKAECLNQRRNNILRMQNIASKIGLSCPNRWINRAVKAYRDFLFSYNELDTAKYYIIAGPLSLRNRMIYGKDLFKNLTEMSFEGSMFPVISDFDYFLKLRYGDYMKLPPEDQRRPYHGQSYYWK